MSATEIPTVIPGQLQLFNDDQVSAESESAPAVQLTVTRPDIKDESGQSICVWHEGQWSGVPTR
jgi:hypothetical protein